MVLSGQGGGLKDTQETGQHFHFWEPMDSGGWVCVCVCIWEPMDSGMCVCVCLSGNPWTVVCVCVYIYCLFFAILGLHSQHMEVPKLRVESELYPPAYTNSHSIAGSEPHLGPTPQLTAMPDP